VYFYILRFSLSSPFTVFFFFFLFLSLSSVSSPEPTFVAGISLRKLLFRGEPPRSSREFCSTSSKSWFFPGSRNPVWSLTWNREWSFGDFEFCEEERIQEGSRARIGSGFGVFSREREVLV